MSDQVRRLGSDEYNNPFGGYNELLKYTDNMLPFNIKSRIRNMSDQVNFKWRSENRKPTHKYMHK